MNSHLSPSPSPTPFPHYSLTPSPSSLSPHYNSSSPSNLSVRSPATSFFPPSSSSDLCRPLGNLQHLGRSNIVLFTFTS
jgi:hypothetical protein